MFNVRKSLITCAAAAVLGAGFLSSCSNVKKDRAEKANALLTRASALVESYKYDSALVVLDTLDIKYRDCIVERNKGTEIRINALASLTRDSLASAELQLRESQQQLDALQPKFKKVEMEGTDGFYVFAPTYTGKEMNTTCLQPRVDDGGYFFIVVNNAGKNIGLNALSYNDVKTAKGESVRIEGTEIMSLMQEGTSAFVDALCNAQAPAVVTLEGTSGKTSVKLDTKALEAMRATRDYARALQTTRHLNINLEKLERQLASLNDQLAKRVAPAETEE